MILHFLFRPVRHFGLIFVRGGKISLDSLFYLALDVQLLQHHLSKILSLLHSIAFAPLSKIS